MNRNYFRYLVGITAIFVAAVGGFFSVTGLQALYAGAQWAIIAFIALEVGKLVTAAALHRNWSRLNFAFKAYLSSAVIILVIVTSAGIFGYLTKGYQDQIANYQQLENKEQLFQQQITRLENRNDEIDQEIADRSERAEQTREQVQAEIDQLMEERNNLPDNYVTMRRNIDDQIEQKRDKLNEQFEASDLRDQKEQNFQKISSLQDSVLSLENTQLTEGGDVGPLIYISKFLNVPMDTVTLAFTTILVFVFDPLAVCLVIIFASLTKPKKQDDEISDSAKNDYEQQEDKKANNQIPRRDDNVKDNDQGDEWPVPVPSINYNSLHKKNKKTDESSQINITPINKKSKEEDNSSKEVKREKPRKVDDEEVEATVNNIVKNAAQESQQPSRPKDRTGLPRDFASSTGGRVIE